MDILNKILSDLVKDNDIYCILTSTPYEELDILHFSVGLYIRNKYLWHDSTNFKALSVFYNTCDVDKISRLLLRDVYFEVHKK